MWWSKIVHTIKIVTTNYNCTSQTKLKSPTCNKYM